MKLFDILLRGAALSPDKPAVRHGHDEITYRQLLASVKSLTAFLRNQPISPDARAAIIWENSLTYVSCFFGITASELTVVPIDTSLGAAGFRKIINDCRPEVLFVQPKFAAALKAAIDEQSSVRLILSEQLLETPANGAQCTLLPYTASDINSFVNVPDVNDLPDDGSMTFADWQGSPDDLAAIFYTSGSTGEPKGVMLSHRNLVSNTVGTVEYLRLTKKDTVLVVLPFYYIYGNSLLLTHLLVGGCVVIENRFAYPQLVIKALEETGVTGFSGVPSTFIMLLNMDRFDPAGMPHLRYITQAGGAMAPDVIRRLMDRVGGTVEIFIMYGQTEASPRISWLPPEMLANHVGSVGQPVPGVEIHLLDDDGRPVADGDIGEIVVGGPGVMLGYWNNNDEKVLRNRLLYTGDLARHDESDLYTIVARKKEIIKAGGYRVSAKEVEETLLEHKAVLEVAVIGIKDPLLGEAIKAVVVLKEPNSCDESDLKNHVKARLPWHKVPKVVEFRDSLPKYKTGKINKLALSDEQS
ncbi:MAG TPA: class I adenylate-forming enzyme family protein [candidate division Zixibacteria bacterium]|nr:class I adenylate-forming enzyme family protein [candidate division Zixibacteria bacterium]